MKIEKDLTKYNLTEQKNHIINSIINTDSNVFITGEAGSGKTYILKVLQDIYEGVSMTVAPTGIAAINAGGVTIHKALKLPISPYKPMFIRKQSMSMLPSYGLSEEDEAIIQSLDVLIIDEISMVRADVMDAMNDALCWYRKCKEPFGGIRLIMFGDAYQLSPVARQEDWGTVSKYYDTPYFFSSKALGLNKFDMYNITENFRQKDNQFIELLNKVRVGNNDRETIDEINKMYKPNIDIESQDYSEYIILTSTNSEAEKINNNKLNELDGKMYNFDVKLSNQKMDVKNFPLVPNLELKIGAKIMTIVNDNDEGQYVNGTIGTLTGIEKNEISGETVLIMDDDIRIKTFVWEDMKYSLNKDTNRVEGVSKGKAEQFPVKVAYAITVHKSQGLTFDKVAVDLSRAFLHGQTYVALSRCRSMEGTILLEKVFPRHIICDETLAKISKKAKQINQ